MCLKAYSCILFYTIFCGLRIVLGNRTQSPHIVLILADDLGLDDVSFRGGTQFLTPNIDALAFSGKIINRMYTHALCTPSRAALLTGMSVIHTGAQHFALSNEEPWGYLQNHKTMAEVFQRHGYSTNLIGKWHLGMAHKEYAPNYKGFDYFYGYLGGFIGYYDKRSKMPTNYSLGYDFRRNLNLECTPEGSYVTDLITKEAVGVIQKHNPEQPLFLIVSHLAAHTGNSEVPLEAPQKEIDKFGYISDEYKRRYAAVVSKLDKSVAHIIKALHSRDLLQNSIVVFSSDNGAPTQGLFSNGGSNWPFKGQKNSPWEGALRVPAAIWSPLLKHKSTIYQPLLHISDLMPTFAEAAGIRLSLPYKQDGVSHWRELIASGFNSSSESVYKRRKIVHVLDEMEPVRSFMYGRFKYIKGSTHHGKYDDFVSKRTTSEIDPRNRNYTQVIKNSVVAKVLAKYNEQPLTAKKIQHLRMKAEINCGQQMEVPCNPLEEECLYDIWKDPCERHNLAKTPKYQTTLEKMKSTLDELQQTAIGPFTGGSSIDYDPTRHDCTWTYYLDEPVKNVISECGYDSPPCQKQRNLSKDFSQGRL